LTIKDYRGLVDYKRQETMSRVTLVRGGIVLGVAAVVVILERKRRARRYREPWLRHTTRNLAVGAIAAVTVSLLETPFTCPWRSRPRDVAGA
jgi:hypothetical protein